ncbi:MAG: hypothetical protein QOE33_3816 [Acidobacteriota bacterium]|jgi:hypothetical protein|nr:hypothetical protein [Acidobacteriota bacterium]
MEYRSEDSPNDAQKWGSLEDLLKLSRDPQNEHIVNALDLPMGTCSVPVPPQFR